MQNVTIHCTDCDRRMPYIVKPADRIPANVTEIRMPGCDLCDQDGNFIEETWYDAAGATVAPNLP